MRAGFGDGGDDRRALDGLEALELFFQALGAARGQGDGRHFRGKMSQIKSPGSGLNRGHSEDFNPILVKVRGNCKRAAAAADRGRVSRAAGGGRHPENP
jgi:hypothetical protein